MYVQANFMNLEKFEDNSFDGVYAIEATCHAPQREGFFAYIILLTKNIFHLLVSYLSIYLCALFKLNN